MGGPLYICVGVSVDTVFYRIITDVTIGTHPEGSYSILMSADRRGQEYVLGEMLSPVFMKECERGSRILPALPPIWGTNLH